MVGVYGVYLFFDSLAKLNWLRSCALLLFSLAAVWLGCLFWDLSIFEQVISGKAMKANIFVRVDEISTKGFFSQLVYWLYENCTKYVM